MKNLGGVLIAVGIVALVGYFVYENMNKNKGITDRVSADKMFIEKFGKPSNPSYGDDYVIAWANALFYGDTEFSIGGKKYNSKTGRQIS